MKRIIIALAATLAAMAFVGSIAYAGQTETGNGAPSGAHYNLNIIGVPKDKSADFSGGDGHRIFVGLGAKNNPVTTKINLTMGDFAVLDANGTDGTAAFQLPNPDPTNTGTSEYSVFARALGKPGGHADMTTCADVTVTDPITGAVTTETECSVSVLSMDRTVGKNGDNKFINATEYLLYIYVDLDGDGVAERYNLFDDALQDYFWQYDNQGLKLLQLRFYPGFSTTVP